MDEPGDTVSQPGYNESPLIRESDGSEVAPDISTDSSGTAHAEYHTGPPSGSELLFTEKGLVPVDPPEKTVSWSEIEDWLDESDVDSISEYASSHHQTVEQARTSPQPPADIKDKLLRQFETPVSTNTTFATHPTQPTSTNHRSRNIVILVDDPINRSHPSATRTNILKTLFVIQADEHQLVYCVSSQGLEDAISPIKGWDEYVASNRLIRAWMSLLLLGNVSWDPKLYICDAYKYLMEHYQSGDKVFLFGSGRGGHIIRALGGMLQQVGLLPPGNSGLIAAAYEEFLGSGIPSRGNEHHSRSRGFRQTYARSRCIPIEFMGIWDSSAVGCTTRFPPYTGDQSVKIFRQALALDEWRSSLSPECYHRTPKEADLLALIDRVRHKMASDPSNQAHSAKLRNAAQVLHERYPIVLTTTYGREMTRVIECWFMGSHSDVDGVNHAQIDGPSLSNIPFRWIIREATRCGLQLDPAGIATSEAFTVPKQAFAPDDATWFDLQKLYQAIEAQHMDGSPSLHQNQLIDHLSASISQSQLSHVVEIAAERDSVSDRETLSKDVTAHVMQGSGGILGTIREVLVDSFATFRQTEESQRRGPYLPREVLPQHTCHTPILRRMQLDTEPSAPEPRYRRPAAQLPPRWPEWRDWAEGYAVDYDVWIR